MDSTQIDELWSAVWGKRNNGHREVGLAEKVEKIEEHLRTYDTLIVRADTSWKIVRFLLGLLGAGEIVALIKLFS